jgi:hypothetical protein
MITAAGQRWDSTDCDDSMAAFCASGQADSTRSQS